MQPDAMADGKEPLFKLQVTELGSSQAVLAASWLHILGDGVPSCAACVQSLPDAINF